MTSTTSGELSRSGRVRTESRVVIRRCAQAAVDLLIQVLFLVVVVLPLGLLLVMWMLTFNIPMETTIVYVAIGLFIVTDIAVSWAVHVSIPSKWDGSTPGMRALKLRIVSQQGDAPTRGQLVARWILLIVDGHLFGLVGLVSILVTARHQRVGDIVARTQVVRRDVAM